jgi:hypothetical protein
MHSGTRDTPIDRAGKPADRLVAANSSGRNPWLAIPSWCISLALHAGLFAALALGVRPSGATGVSAEADREVGIYSGTGHQATDLPGSDPGSDGGESAQAQTERNTVSGATLPEELSLDESPPAPLDLPSSKARNSGLIGPGRRVESSEPANVQDTIRPSRNGTAASGGDRTQAGTSFFGVTSVGTRFVYLLDASGSMNENYAIAVAKAELLASLERLAESQQFQVIFYNEKVRAMVASDGKPGLFFGTAANKGVASQFIRGVQPDGGTRHRPAILQALASVPDVIFFLTDAGQPELTAADLNEIKRRNGGKTVIHTIEFGKGANLGVDNFLKKLARENGGIHMYRDITQFQAKDAK